MWLTILCGRPVALAEFVDGDTERYEVLGSAYGRRQLLPALTVAGQDVEALDGLLGQVGQQDASDPVAGFVDGGDEQVWLTVESGQDDNVADAGDDYADTPLVAGRPRV
ncbi:hypothetical protein [Haloarcula sp. 1CSR25-25]|uniref:hypothetical protein n=1 Tax=Haloarcula sp. 1CSR25-25 TaxID=2862545 RepID=UPI002893CE26|nr:hypothetical protein [Haloarcula sp. 1CSR25-25]MDT3437359.1 hypothetical protein [Haloarcula sp. 1CSR25-25]